MKSIKRTFVTLFTTVFTASMALFLTVLIGAACSEKVTLRFETGGGTYLSSVEGNVGASYIPPTEPVKEGYYFDGWYLSADFTGARQELPAVMPEESVTYYAKYGKYPVLTLDPANGGERVELYIKPGELLAERLGGLVPEREGLLFGGWAGEGGLLSEGATMPDGDLALTARYLARYSVRAYLQSADDPALYLPDPALSYAGSGWEGELFAPVPETPEHFRLVKSDPSRTLSAGENDLSFFFEREPATVRFYPDLPADEGPVREERLRYGAHLSLPAPESPEGYAFFGWTEGDDGRRLPAGRVVELSGDLELHGVWAERFRAARGEGELFVALSEENGVRQAVYRAPSGEETEGSCRGTEFTVGDRVGRLDGQGYFRFDDSGVYPARDLNDVIDGRLGTLTLDFSTGEATYRTQAGSFSGEYEYEFANGDYTGNYLFRARERGGDFLFRLEGESFLRQGEERGEYTLYDAMNDLFSPVTLTLDGFGEARLSAEEECSGRYAGSPATWRFEGEREFFFLLGGREWADDEVFFREACFLIYRPERAGRYSGEGGAELSLDGYGLEARYRKGEEEIMAPFTLSGNLLTLCTESPLRFTLKEGNFAPTGKEAGVYAGKAPLFLDGAGGGTLYGADGEPEAKGIYFPVEGAAGEFRFVSDRTEFRFRLSGDSYELYDEGKSGRFFTDFGETLQLNGYGGGRYCGDLGKEVEITLLRFDGEYLEIYAPDFVSRTHSKVFCVEGTLLFPVACAEGGSYRLFGEGEIKETVLFLGGSDRSGAGVGYFGETKGEYRYLRASSEAVFSDGENVITFLLTERNGVPVSIVRGQAGAYEGEQGALVLDGYGTATFAGEETPCTRDGDLVQFERAGRLYRFELSENGYRLTRFVPFGGSDELFLEEGGPAVLFGAERQQGTYEGGELLTVTLPGGTIRYRMREGNYYRFDESKKVRYRTTTGGALSLDGCGFATLEEGEERYEGEIVRLDTGILVFSCDDLPSVGGKRAFAPEDIGLLRALGEFGSFRGPAGETLELFGDGNAKLVARGTIQIGKISPCGENEFDFAGDGTTFRFRIAREDVPVFRIFREALAAHAGSYEGEEGSLLIDGYGAVLEGAETVRELRFFNEEALLFSENGRWFRAVLDRGSFELREVTKGFVRMTI